MADKCGKCHQEFADDFDKYEYQVNDERYGRLSVWICGRCLNRGGR